MKMIKTFKKLVAAWKSMLLYVRCKRAIRKADRMAVVTGKKWLVLVSRGKPVVVSKQCIRRLIKQGYFTRDFTPAKAEEIAIHKTR